MRQFVVMKLMGRFGNQFYQIATGLAYAKRENLDFYVTSTAENAQGNVYYFNDFPKRDLGGNIYMEKINEQGNAYYADIPRMPNCFLIGYWQSFKYFDDQREHILQSFNVPYQPVDLVSIHVRRGDYVTHSDQFPPLPLEYYQSCVQRMNDKGHFRFMVFSDDMDYCREMFTEDKFGNNEFLFSENTDEHKDFAFMSSCKHNICANSSFSFAAAWLNQNPDKVVLCPPINKMFKGCNLDMIPDYFTTVEF